MKKILTFLALVAVLTVPLSVYGASAPIIGDVDFTDYFDENGRLDGRTVTVRADVTVPSGCEEISILFASEDISDISGSAIEKIIYINQIPVDGDGVIEFPADKAKIMAALGTKDIADAELYLKIGGVGLDGYDKKTVTFKDPTVYGDADGDGRTNPKDLSFLQRYLASWDGYGDSKVNTTVCDINGDGLSNPIDAAILARHLASWEGYETLPFIK